MESTDYFGLSDAIKTLQAPEAFSDVHQVGYSWAVEGQYYQTTTKVGALDWNRIIAQFRGLLTIEDVDLSDLDADSPFVLREALTRAIAATLDAPGFSNVVGTSGTLMTIGTGPKSIAIAEDVRGWGVGARVRVASGMNFMEGIVTAYSGNTLQLSVDVVRGSGTFSEWTISVAGEPGSIDFQPGVLPFESVAQAAGATVPATVKSIDINFYNPLYAVPNTLVGKQRRVRMSKADIDSAGIPILAYHRSKDRFMPDGVTPDATNGGYWVLANTTIELDMLGAVGADATVDTAAFYAAAALGRPILLNEKTYHLVAGDELDVGLTITGRDRHKSIIRWMDATGSTSLLRVAGATVNWSLSNLTIDGNRQGHLDNTSYFAAIDFGADDGSVLEIDDVDFLNGRIVDVRVQGPTTSGEKIFFYLRGCWFYDGLVGTATRSAICVQCQDNVEAIWEGNEAALPSTPASYGRGGFVFQRANGSPVTAYGSVIGTGNRFKNIGRGTADTLGCLDVYSGAVRVSFTANTMLNVPGRAISVKGDQDNIVISSNIVENCLYTNATAIALFQDLFTSVASKNLIVAGNIISGSEGDGIFIDGEGLSGARYKNAKISGNIIEGVTGRALLGRYFADRLAFEKNLIDGATAGLSITDCNGFVVIKENTFANISANAIDGFGTMTAAKVYIEDNKFESITGRNISLAAVKSYSITGNTITDGAFAFYTNGSTAPSIISRNEVAAMSSGLWSKSGTDAAVRWRDNDTVDDLSFSVRNLTIASGAITVFADWHYVSGEGGAADDLTTINGLGYDRMVRLRPSSSSVDITVKDGGNLALAGDFLMDNSQDSITLKNMAGTVTEIARSNNAA